MLLLEEGPHVLSRLPSPHADAENHVLREAGRLSCGAGSSPAGLLLSAVGPWVYLEVRCTEGQETGFWF